MPNTLPLVYACSGCSNVAQLANDIALKLTRENKAEMSCIAGVGGKVRSLVKQARSGRPIIAIDGCALHCAKQCLANIDMSADLHLTLTDHRLRKRKHEAFDDDDLETAYRIVLNEMDNRL